MPARGNELDQYDILKRRRMTSLWAFVAASGSQGHPEWMQ